MPRPQLPAPNSRPARAGDKLFAWMMRGLNAGGRAVVLKGHMSNLSEEAALADIEAGLGLIEVDDPQHRPVCDVIIDVWEIPHWHMVGVLQTNGYTIDLPPHLKQQIQQAGGRQ